MNNVIDITTGQPIVRGIHRRIADKIADIIKAEIPDATNICVEHIETICVCGYRDLYGPHICAGCPENQNPGGGSA